MAPISATISQIGAKNRPRWTHDGDDNGDDGDDDDDDFVFFGNCSVDDVSMFRRCLPKNQPWDTYRSILLDFSFPAT